MSERPFKLIEVSLEEVLKQHGYGDVAEKLKRGEADLPTLLRVFSEISLKDPTIIIDERELKAYKIVRAKNG